MLVLLAGGSGLIGSALKSALRADGHELRTLVRRPPRSKDEIEWQPSTDYFDATSLIGVDAVICLSGVGVGEHRWSDSFKQSILTSRTSSVGTLARAIGSMSDGPRIFISGSAIGYYGDTGDHRVDESSPNGIGFFADVCAAWEAAAAPALASGARVVNLRTGIVLAKDGPVLGRMVPLFKLGVGGPLGNGRQYWSWISLTDEIAAIHFLLTSDVSGPVNLTAPAPVTNAEFTRTLAHAVHRPAILPAPPIALRAVLGQFASDILSSQRVVPAKLLDAGYAFRYPDLEGALRAELAS